MIKWLQNEYKRSKFVVLSDDVLVVAVCKAKTSGVVRLTLSDIPFAHFYVRNDEEGAKLGFTTGREDFVVLGVFADHVDADAVLKEIRREMLRIEIIHKLFSMRTFITGMSVILTLIFIMWAHGKLTQQNLPQLNEPLALEDLRDSAASPASEPGKPVDADSKLNVPE
ncbi:MAG: hypothetical protein EB059_04240 [Alphaproteobacteria bacterium]|nr:hypothetical protein [Alphaproteobacteria bacterium]